MGRLIDADRIIYHEIDEIGGEYEPYLGCSKSQIDNLPPVEAIPIAVVEKFFEEGTKNVSNNVLAIVRENYIHKADYENRLKADLEAILVELQVEIHELENPYPHDKDNLLPLASHNAFYEAKSEIEDLVEEKIDALKGGK